MSFFRFCGTIVLLSVVLLVAACGSTPQATPTPTAPAVPTATPTPIPRFPVTIQDSNGNSVIFDEPPERIVAYDGAAVETLFAMGEGHRVVATHSLVSYPPQVDDIPRVGDASNIDIEAILALEPDLVFIFFPRFNEQLENAGLKVLYLHSLNNDFLKTTDNIRLWGEITGNTEAAEALSSDFEERVARVKNVLSSQPPGPSVFYDTFQLWTPGPDTLIGNVLDLLNLQNAASEISGYEQMSPEAFVESDPEVIFTSDSSFFTDNPAFSEVTAVKEGKIFPATELLSVAGPRFIEGIEELAGLVYPELFP